MNVLVLNCSAASVRFAIIDAGTRLDRVGFAGFLLDAEANAVHGKALQGRITRTTKPMAAVIATNEELMIALDTAELVGEREDGRGRADLHEREEAWRVDARSTRSGYGISSSAARMLASSRSSTSSSSSPPSTEAT
jgi:hypothetical protein